MTARLPPIAVTTANFLPASAVSVSALARIQSWSRTEGFAAPELLVARVAVRAPPLGMPWTSVHEVWNPRVSMRRELRNILCALPQSRGMTPSLVDSLFFANGARSEQALFLIAGQAGVPAVVSELQSPFSEMRYASGAACIQVHPDMGPGGSHLPLGAVADHVETHDYGVVLDTNHVRRRVRRHPNGRTEISPPLAVSGEASLGGIAAVWARLGERVRLVHLQFSTPAELACALGAGAWPDGWDAFREILPALAARGIPVVLEINAGWMTTATARCGLSRGPMQDALCRIRDLLARSAA